MWRVEALRNATTDIAKIDVASLRQALEAEQRSIRFCDNDLLRKEASSPRGAAAGLRHPRLTLRLCIGLSPSRTGANITSARATQSASVAHLSVVWNGNAIEGSACLSAAIAKSRAFRTCFPRSQVALRKPSVAEAALYSPPSSNRNSGIDPASRSCVEKWE